MNSAKFNALSFASILLVATGAHADLFGEKFGDNASNNTAPKEEEKAAKKDHTIWGEAAGKPILSMAEAGLSTPRTVYVPGRYTLSGNGALFVKGNQVAIPGRESNILGFISSGKDYLVANYTSKATSVPVASMSNAGVLFTTAELAAMSPMDRLRALELQAKARNGEQQMISPVTGPQVQFYSVDEKGNVGRMVSAIPVADTTLLVTGKAMFVRRAESRFMGRIQLYSYTGINSDGTTVTGPQNVSYGTPSVDGQSWFVTKPTSGRNPEIIYASYDYDLAWWSPNGGYNVLESISNRYANLDQFINTTGIFIDGPNLTDSVRVGAVMRAVGQTQSPMGSDGLTMYFTPYSFELPLKRGSDGQYSMSAATKVGSVSMQQAISVAKEAAARTYLFKNKSGELTAATQASGIGSFSGRNYSLINISRKDVTPLYSIFGGGVGLFRTFLSGTTTFSVEKNNDAYMLFTPSGETVVKVANPGAQDNSALALNTKQYVDAVQVGNLIRQLGVSLN